jgi:hypothetical protein
MVKNRNAEPNLLPQHLTSKFVDMVFFYYYLKSIDLIWSESRACRCIYVEVPILAVRI